MEPRLVIAMGGNGFTSGTSPGLDDFVLDAIPGGVRRIGFVGTASDDDPVRVGFFRSLVAPRVALASVFDLRASAAEAARWAAGLDMIYVGGGDTARMLGSWRGAGIDQVFASAGRDGVVLAGVSAGAVCWFERALVMNKAGTLEPIECLGLLPGSVCAHYDTDAERRARFAEGIAAGSLPPGIGIEDGVAAVCARGAPPRAFSAEAGRWAYAVSRDGDGKAVGVPLPSFVQGQARA